MTVRPATAADLPGIDWLDDGATTGLATAFEAGPRALVLVAVADRTPRGVLVADLPPWRKRTVPWVWLIEVAPAHRRAGHGIALLRHAHRALLDRGHRAVELSVEDTNTAARRLYDRLGYRATGVGTAQGVDRPDAWTRMRLELRAGPAR